MYRLVYVSTAAVDLDETELEVLLGPSRVKNETTGVTGLLVQIQDSAGGPTFYLQHLEGLYEAVERTYRRISLDELHTEVTVVRRDDEEGRWFAGRPMRLVTLTVGPEQSAADLVRDPAAVLKLISTYAEPNG